MRLLIISAMPHHRRAGEIVGWGPTVRELDHLATRFSHVRHIAPLHASEPSSSYFAYTAKNIELVPVRPAGADGLLGKVDALRASPAYVETIVRELRDADFVHVRAPCNIALVAIILLGARRQPRGRWIKYAGNWKPDGPESAAYTLQRWWLARPWHRGIVTVNGRWPGQEPWVRTFYNPSLDDATVALGREVAAGKRLTSPLELLYIGRVETPKGTGRAIEIVHRLAKRGIAARLQIVGDGPERATFEARVAELGLADRIHFVGWQSHHGLLEYFRRAHFSLLPTKASEGWPKVLSEGMAFGVVPIAGAVSSIPQYLEDLGVGTAIPADDLDTYVDTLARYAAAPDTWQRESARCVEAGRFFTFAHYLTCIDALIADATAA